MASTLKGFVLKAFERLLRLPVEELIEQRYQKFRRMGVIEEE
jgi:acetyl-CoA carboxylase alpha subunit